jgi:uncharacterized repeat protein (TIGR02543 family)
MSASEPVHWHSGGTADGTWSGMMPNTMSQGTQVRPGSSGSKSIHLVPNSVLGVTANGSMTNGRIHAGSMQASGTSNYNYTQRSNSSFSTPITMVPDSVAVWICFRSQSSTDKGFVKAVVHGDTDYQIIANGTESPTNMRVAEAYIEFTRTAPASGAYNWRRLSIPFVPGASNDPRYILFVATTNKDAGEGSTNDDLFVDDVLLIYNPTLTMGNLASHEFQANDAITIPFTLTGTMSPDNLNAAPNEVIVQMSNANGSFNFPTELGRVTTNTSGSITAQIPAAYDGNYQIRVISTNYPMVGGNIQQITITSPTYTVTASANPSDGGTVSGAGQYSQGAPCTMTATANTGYTFTNWTENGNVVSTEASFTFGVTGNRTLVANFTANIYNVTATANPSAGGTVSGAGEYSHGASCTVTATANEGYTFINWTENGSVVSSETSYTFNVTADHNLVANFSLNTYNVTTTANPSAGGTVSGAGEYNHGASCTVTATANEGYTFANWTENGSVVSTDANYTFTVTSNRYLMANFTINTYNVTATCDPDEGGMVSGAGEYNHGESCTVTASANEGYTFINWTENGTQVSSQAEYTFTVEGDRNLVAHFTSQGYIITAVADPEEGGVVTGSNGYNFGDSCTLTATANEGYTFVNWTKDGEEVTTETEYSFTVSESATYVAHFSINTYTISAMADPEDGGTVAGGGEYVYGSTCTLVATANESYDFMGWFKGEDLASTETSYTFTVTASETYTAVFSFDDGVEENTTISQIFPNPFTSTVSIKAEKVIKKVVVYDFNGRVVKVRGVSDTNVDLDMSDLSTGSYLLQLDYGNSRSIHRITKAN